jgi:hypothetical protein
MFSLSDLRHSKRKPNCDDLQCSSIRRLALLQQVLVSTLPQAATADLGSSGMEEL